MKIKRDEIISYREMCDSENKQTLQRGMNYRINSSYSLILMSQRPNAPYNDKIHPDGITIEYEGHDISRNGPVHNPKVEDQPTQLPSGGLTQNGKFVKAIEETKQRLRKAELVRVYEKIMSGIWSFKGYFRLVDYKTVNDGRRNVYRFILRLSDNDQADINPSNHDIIHTRLIPSEVKKEVWKRDRGKCVVCGTVTNLHFDHDLPFSRGGTSLTAKNVRLLCMKHNLEKSNRIQ